MSNNHEVDLLGKTVKGFNIFEVKATQTIKPTLLKNMDYFEEIAGNTAIKKTLIYGGIENQERSKYTVLGWPNINT